MPATYEPIASTTLGSAAASHTFTSIPAGFTDLVLICVTGSTGTSQSLRLELNGDTGTNYSRTMLYAITTPVSARSSNQNDTRIANRISDGSPTSTVVCHFMSYSNTNVYKTILSSVASPDGTSVEVGRFVHLWRDTSAISSISIITPNDNLVVGTTFSLFGVKAA